VIETFELAAEPLGINIGLSQQRAGRDATRFLLSLGHRRVGFMVGHLDVRAAARLAGYREAMAEAGLADACFVASVPKASSVALGSQILADLCSRGALPEAFFCIDDNLGLGAILECRRRGIRVPEDLSILGFHDLEFAACASPSLSSVATRRYEMGRRAAEEAIAAIAAGGRIRPRTIDMGYEIVVRESTRPLRPA
jgi:LacI family gluconate utilization system Gnt-I transcriptional repressor